MADEWHYTKGETKHGPVSASELKSLAQSGRLLATDLVWKEGMSNWKPAESVKGLFPSRTSPPLQSVALVPATESLLRNLPLVADGHSQNKNVNTGILQKILSKLPVFSYQVKKRIKASSATEKSVMEALLNKFSGSDLSRTESGSIIVKKYDRIFDLGVIDKWLTMNWFMRDVTAKFTIANNDNGITIIADITQGWTLIFLLTSCALCVGVVSFCWQWLCAGFAKKKIELKTQQMLEQIAGDA